jgi:hypothetical protein
MIGAVGAFRLEGSTSGAAVAKPRPAVSAKRPVSIPKRTSGEVVRIASRPAHATERKAPAEREQDWQQF